MSFFGKLFGNKSDPTAAKNAALAQDYYETGARFAAKQIWKQAILALNEAVRLNPTHAKAHMMLCLAYGATMDMEGARRHLNVLKQLDPGLASQVVNTPAGMLIDKNPVVVGVNDRPTQSTTELTNPDPQATKELMGAIEDEQVEDVKFLIENEVDVNAKTDDGATPLWFACGTGSVEIVRLLLNAGAQVNQRSVHMITPLIEAAMAANPEMVKVLIERGAEIDAQDDLGETALHRAAYVGSETVARLLIENKADLRKANHEGLTATALADQRGHQTVAKLIRAAGGK